MRLCVLVDLGSIFCVEVQGELNMLKEPVDSVIRQTLAMGPVSHELTCLHNDLLECLEPIVHIHDCSMQLSLR